MNYKAYLKETIIHEQMSVQNARLCRNFVSVARARVGDRILHDANICVREAVFAYPARKHSFQAYRTKALCRLAKLAVKHASEYISQNDELRQK